MKRRLLSIALCLAALLQLRASDPDIALPLRFDRYYTYDEVVEALQLLQKTYPRLSSLELVGKSEENRDIWALVIHNPATGAEREKPGVYVDGNIHGNEIQAGEVCLYLANTLLTKYGENEKVTRLVDKNVYYIIPVVNVDGRYHFFEDGNTPNTNRGLRRAKDDDRDGLFDEDFPDDLNGDGNITSMRIKDPLGQFKPDPEDPRILVRVKPGEQGSYTLLGDEGIDNDGDGQINEDSEGYVDGNRNWGYNWAPPYVQRGAGDFPLSGTGTRAIAEYILERENIVLVWAFHNNGGMFLRGPSTRAEGEPPRQDVDVYDYLGENAESIVPGYEYLIVWKDLYSTYGDFTTFTSNIVGAYSLVGELFQTESQTYKSKHAGETGGVPFTREQQNREQLEFNDNVALGELYVDWQPYHHPTYGDIEIGGWVKMSRRLPHPFMLTDLVHRTSMAVLFSAEQTPEVSLEVFLQEKVDKDLTRIRVRLTNAKAIPSVSHMVKKNRPIPRRAAGTREKAPWWPSGSGTGTQGWSDSRIPNPPSSLFRYPVWPLRIRIPGLRERDGADRLRQPEGGKKSLELTLLTAQPSAPMDLPELIQTQRDFFRTDRTKSPAFRREQLRLLHSVLREAEDRLYEAIHADFGKSEFETYATELALVYHELKLALRKLGSWSRDRRVRTNLANLPGRSRVMREPLGNTLVIGAWNYLTS
ncbi:MAG: aldehyde dehydrogenase family protein [Bacteroidales bacterium]